MSDAPPARTRSSDLVIAMVVPAGALLGGCGDAHPLFGPNSPRDGAGRAADPIYGTPLPGVPLGSGGS